MAIVESPAEAAAPGAPSRAVGDYINDYFRRLAGGELGALPAVAGLVVLCVIFTVLRPVFFSALNFANLFTQGAQVVVIAMGLVFVLLLGEIDLSAGFTSGVCAAVLATLLTNRHWPWYLAVRVAVITGVVIGTVLGTLVSKVRIPSFVVTLAAFLAFQGIALLMLKNGTNISISDPVIGAIENRNLPDWLSWALLAALVAGYLGVHLLRIRSRAARGLPTDPLPLVAFRVGAVAVIGGPGGVLPHNRGGPDPVAGGP